MSFMKVGRRKKCLNAKIKTTGEIKPTKATFHAARACIVTI